jgi:hypothetical protein
MSVQFFGGLGGLHSIYHYFYLENDHPSLGPMIPISRGIYYLHALTALFICLVVGIDINEAEI